MKTPDSLSFTLVLGAFLTLPFVGCNDLGSDPGPAENFALSVSASHTHTALGSAGHEALVLTSVKVLVRDIRLKEAASDDGSDVKTGSFVTSLAVDGSVTNVAFVRIRPGIYDHLRLTIHKPEDDEPVDDPDFRDEGGSGNRFSVVVTGIYHETPFVFRSRVNAAQDLPFAEPIEVPADGSTNVTLKVDPYEWFTIGELVLDPFIQADEIDDRIVSSFADVFRDRDGNGQPD